MGLGTSGNVGNTFNNSIGGESQFFVIGVQAGVICMIIYISTYICVILKAKEYYSQYNGKIKRLALMVLLLKVGLIIPTITSELESYIYISYIVWFFTGYLINLTSTRFLLKEL